jgi:hypothetical protein
MVTKVDRKTELEGELAAINAELSRPELLKRRRDAIREELRQLNRPDNGVEFVCLGAPYQHDGDTKFSTVVVLGDDNIIKLPPNYKFNDMSESEVGLSQDTFLKAYQKELVYRGGIESVVSKDRADKLIAAGCHVIARQHQPTVRFTDNVYDPA